MEWHKDFARVLRESFARSRNQESCSLRGFAKKVGVPVSTLSESIREKNIPSAERAREILERLDLEAREKNMILALMGFAPGAKIQTLPSDDYEILSDWRHIAVLMAFELENLTKTPEAIAARLGVDPEKVRAVVTELIARGLVERLEDGQLRKVDRPWQATESPPCEVLRLHHLENLKTAEIALQRTKADERDFTTTTVVGNLKHIELIRKEIREMHKRAAALVEGSSPRDRVVRLSVSFYPLDVSQP